jgi:hypothetical protein
MVLTYKEMFQKDWVSIQHEQNSRYNRDAGWREGFYASLQGCRIVLLDSNELAIAPGAVCDDDIFCLLQGGHSPCILRSHQDSYWKLVSGDCRGLTFQDPGFILPFADEAVFPYAAYYEELKEMLEMFTIC